jgi:hypothetical protein
VPPAGEVPQCRSVGGRLHHRKGAHFQGFFYNLLLILFILEISVVKPEPEPTTFWLSRTRTGSIPVLNPVLEPDLNPDPTYNTGTYKG